MNLAAIKELRGVPIGQVLAFAHSVGATAVPLTAIKILDADPQRVAVTFSLAVSVAYYLGNAAQVTHTTGYPMSTFGAQLVVSDDTHPGMAAMPWYVIATSTGGSMGWVATRIIG